MKDLDEPDRVLIGGQEQAPVSLFGHRFGGITWSPIRVYN